MKTHLKHATSGNNSARHCAKFRGKDVAKFANEILSRYSNAKFCHAKVRRGLIFPPRSVKEDSSITIEARTNWWFQRRLESSKDLPEGTQPWGMRYRRYLFLVPTGNWRNNFQNLVQGLLGQEKAVSWYLVLLEVSWYLVLLADHETSRAAKFGKSCHLWFKKPLGKSWIFTTGRVRYRGSVGLKNKEEVARFEGKFLLPSTQSV